MRCPQRARTYVSADMKPPISCHFAGRAALVAAALLLVTWPAPPARAAESDPEVADEADGASENEETDATDDAPSEGSATDGEVPTGDGWAVTAGAFTEAPLQLGAELYIDAPGPLRLRGGIGYLPSGYMQAANAILVGAFDEYSEDDAALVESTIGNSLLWQVGGGFVTGDNQGFYLLAGYTAATFAGTAASGDLVERATDREIPDRVKNRYGDREFDVDSTLHQLDLELGVEWKFDHLSLRSGIGWSWTFASSATVRAKFGEDDERVRQALDEIENEAESHLNDTYRSYIHPPYLTVGMGFSFH